MNALLFYKKLAGLGLPFVALWKKGGLALRSAHASIRQQWAIGLSASIPAMLLLLSGRGFSLLSLAEGASSLFRSFKINLSSQSLPLRGLCENANISFSPRSASSHTETYENHAPTCLASRLVWLIILLVIATPSFSQKKVKLKHANTAYGSMKDGERFDRLVGDVIFEQNTTTIYCDSAHYFKTKNMLDAFGRVHITEGDSVDITARGLSYDGNTKIAKLRKNVVFVKKKIATLYTDFLDYDRVKNEARYFNGGKLVDTTNTLTSRKGYYDVPVNVASFKTKVVCVNPDYTLTSDTLQYNSKTRVIYFRDTTLVKGKDGKNALYKSGTYNTIQKLSVLDKGEFETPSYKMKGDQNLLDDVKKYYTSKGKVSMTSKQEKMTIYGDDGFYDKKNGISKVFGHAYVTKVDDDGDTLFLAADTLVSIENVNPKKKRLLAYNHVKIFKNTMQGSADSLAYVAADSVLYLYKGPILWSDGNQMTADSIRMLLKNKEIDKIFMTGNSFVISQDSMKNFNQIKGRKMTAHFNGKNISHVIVQGNGESLYFALEEKELARTDSAILKLMITMGMNKMICSNMRINFVKGKVNNVSFYVKPDANLIPIHELKREDRTLKGFAWRRKERPSKSEVERKKSI
jgi:lipopolysaccharide export system protein LptA